MILKDQFSWNSIQTMLHVVIGVTNMITMYMYTLYSCHELIRWVWKNGQTHNPHREIVIKKSWTAPEFICIDGLNKCLNLLLLFCRAHIKNSNAHKFQNTGFCIFHISPSISILCQKF